jgi:hypothetical protein
VIAEALAILAATNGFKSLGIAHGAPSLFVENPVEIADAVARRSYSWLWSVTGEQWRELVEPAIAALRARPGPGPPGQAGARARAGAPLNSSAGRRGGRTA